MLANLFTKSIRDRWLGTTLGAAIVGLVLIGAMAAYRQVDISIYTDLPESIRSVMGIPDDADSATLAYNIGLGLIAALTLAGLALSMGASTVAGEERDGTIGLLLANPRSRRRILAAKTAAMVGLAAGASLLVLGAAHFAPAVLDVAIGRTQIDATIIHLFANTLVWAAAATALGAVTGNRALASAATAGVMVGCYFLVGLLPLIDSLADVAKVLPWYWFDGHDPLNNGLAPGYLALQIGAVVVLTGLAWWGVEARDLRNRDCAAGAITQLMDRVRSNDRAACVLERFSGRARLGSIWARAATDGQGLVAVTALVMFGLMGLLMGPMYAAIEGTLADFSADLPENLLAMVGGGDLSTPEGWYRLESFGLMAPIALTLVAAAAGARALAGEERDRTMGVLLANPVSRRRVVLQKATAMWLQTLIVGAATFAGVAGGSILGGLGMSIPNIAAISLHATLLGMMFGALALAVGAATGDARTAIVATIALFGAAYLANSLLGIADSLEGWAALSPFEWYLGGEPLLNGVEWTSVALFGAFTAVLVAAAAALFDRRDLKRG